MIVKIDSIIFILHIFLIIILLLKDTARAHFFQRKTIK